MNTPADWTPNSPKEVMDKQLEWKRCLVWLAIQAGLYQDAAIMAVYGDIAHDERIVTYYRAFPEFRTQIIKLVDTRNKR